ncbi:LysM peptidoglycan-binding domain-containing protein [Tautonia plasticadhaerens]|uniref:LysM domain protein n=1 Tax=Tautonia plasticadhaerens TaxID=2527974 RepID=A0A518GYX2_9BACT|nr:LysM domain-containing protein [Tautonia plasticadhaerens]QDV33753.1 LysM domain protein [Tautonia plasticadhaerens]
MIRLSECVVIANDAPTTLPALYVVKSGDTLTAIARRNGYGSWRDIYQHPDNSPFRAKRPNPDKIFPGDELVLPGRPLTHEELAALGASGGGGGGGLHLLHLPMSLRLNNSAPLNLTQGRGTSDQFATDYVHPGNVKIRLTLFWLSNCVSPDTSTAALLTKAEALFKTHGLGLDILPSRARTAEHTIPVSADPILPEQYNSVRLEAGKRFDDQKSPGKKQRLPVFFGEFKYPAKGVTVVPAPPSGSPWLPYCIVSGVLSADHATLAHEIVHASGIGPHVIAKDFPKNILTDLSDNREEFWKMQVQSVANAYFCR